MKSFYKAAWICLLLVCVLQPTPMVSAQGEGWLTGWDYRAEFLVTGSVGASTNYQVLYTVPYDADMQTDFDDLRVTASDGTTEWDYWIEEYTASTTARLWIEVRDDLDSSTSLFLYWGNVAVSTTSDGEDTFLMYEDWTSESLRGSVWDLTDANGGVTYNAAGAQHGTIARFQGDAGATYKITSDYDTASPIALMLRMNMEEAGVGNTARVGSGHDGAFAFNLIDSTDSGEQFYVYDDDANQDSQAMTNAYVDSWITFQITRDGTNSKLYADTVLIETASCDPDIVTTNPVASLRVTDSEDDIYSDWFAARKYTAGTEPILVAGEWAEIGSVNLFFSVYVNPWFLNTALIFLGLIMIPLSTIYLVRGGRKGASMDKLFISLLVLMMGFGLLIGGIMP